MLKNTSMTRLLAITIKVFIMINTVALVILGIYLTFHALWGLPQRIIYADSEVRPGLELIESIDVFLIALVFLVFIVGINVLFINPDDKAYLSGIPKWMRVKNFSELKFLLMEAIIATLFILLVSALIRLDGAIDWSFLILPVTILLLSISLKALKWKEAKKNE